MTNSLFELLFEGFRGNVCISFIARWKARGRFPIYDNWTFTIQTLSADIGRSVLFSKRVGHFKRKFQVEGDITISKTAVA